MIKEKEERKLPKLNQRKNQDSNKEYHHILQKTPMNSEFGETTITLAQKTSESAYARPSLLLDSIYEPLT